MAEETKSSQREEMEAIIARGCGVLYGGRVITRIEHLPSDAELAANDARKRVSRREQLTAEIEALQREIDRLEIAERPHELPASGAAADAPEPKGTEDKGPRTEGTKGK